MTTPRSLQIVSAFLGLGWAWLRLRRRAPQELPKRLRRTIEGLGTTFIKLGQGLSLRRDLLPTEYREALDLLNSHALPFDSALAVAAVATMRARSAPLSPARATVVPGWWRVPDDVVRQRWRACSREPGRRRPRRSPRRDMRTTPWPEGGVVVLVADPRAMFTLVDNAAVSPVAAEAEERLRRVIDAVGGMEAV
jgi:hypothetical protein